MEILVASYARFSSQNQREASIEIQQEHINKFCRDNRFTIIKEYVDRAQSATTDNRPQFQQMIADAESGTFKAVVVYNSSRFCRNIQDHLKYKAVLESYGVRILSVQEGFDETTPEGDLMNNFMMSINQYYSKDLSRKIYLGCLESAKKGLHVGGPAPYGFSITPDRHYEINEKEAEVVRIIFDKIAKGMTYKQVADFLNENGYRRRDGSKFTPFFYDLVTNRKYIGEYVWNKTKKKNAFGNRSSRLYKEESEVVRIPHALPQIVDEVVFEVVSKVVSARKEVRRQSGIGKFLLTSLVVCDYCGFKMCGDTNTNGNGKGTFTRIVYKCDSSRRRNIKCRCKPIHAVRLENYIINLVNVVLLNTSYSKQIKRLMKYKLGEEYDSLHIKYKKLVSEIEDIRKSIENLVGALSEARSVAYEEILKGVEKNTRIKQKKEKELEHLQQLLETTPHIHEEIIWRRILRFRKAISNNSIDSLKTLLRILIKEIRVSNDEVRVRLNLNAYLTSSYENKLEVVVVERRSNIEDINMQANLALTWAMLNIQ